ncbi:hypothetical protein F5Y04DRAFT_290239 [Hypomontagnella monticulosa]|nr:hypothetical protein F5Y04DRAFT_290239 [Hypomontagnella monticulosa]
MTDEFDTSPEKEARITQYLYRQLFVHTPAVSRQEVNLRGKTAIITGSNSGIGLESARQLLDLGLSRLILAVRDESKGEAARANLLYGRDLKLSAIEVWKLDYLSYDSVTNFVKRTDDLTNLDIVVLNAGVYRFEFGLSAGHEEDIKVNYLSTMLLAMLILPILKAKKLGTRPGRLVVVTSDVAAWCTFKERHSIPLLPAFDMRTKQFDPHERYAVSKLLGQIFLKELAQRVPPSAVVVSCVTPGFCRGSQLGRDTVGTIFGYFFKTLQWLIGRSTSEGASVVVDAVVRHGEEAHGKYLQDGKITPMAPIVYTTEGEYVTKLLWKETMNEFSFAGVEEAVRSMRE